MAAKAAQFGPEAMRRSKSRSCCQTIDSKWREHLLTLEHLRSVVGFRGYAQRDPLNEYKTEAFQLFEGLLDSLRLEVTGNLSRVRPMTGEEQAAMIADLKARQAELARAAGAAGPARRRIGPEVGQWPRCASIVIDWLSHGAALPGDGIGPFDVIAWFEDLVGGGAAYDVHGTPLADATMAKAQEVDAVLLGAVGGPKYDRLDFSVKPERGLLRLRKEMDLYANLRPAQCFDALADFSSLKREWSPASTS
jgi:hypothetical protein